MSRIGKHPVPVPAGVTVTLDGQTVSAKGKLGNHTYIAHDEIAVSLEAGKITVVPKSDSRTAREQWGTARTNIANLVNGVGSGFTVKLEINGVGYRAAVQGKELVLQLGYSHDIKYAIPEGVTMVCEKPTNIAITGPSKQQVGQIAAEIRSYRGPEPYKGKGIKYEGEKILRKEGKKK